MKGKKVNVQGKDEWHFVHLLDPTQNKSCLTNLSRDAKGTYLHLSVGLGASNVRTPDFPGERRLLRSRVFRTYIGA